MAVSVHCHHAGSALNKCQLAILRHWLRTVRHYDEFTQAPAKSALMELSQACRVKIHDEVKSNREGWMSN